MEEFIPYLEKIWDAKWITNNGQFHQQLEKALADYLGVEYISVFTNGTLPLITALQALRITGEVITTPYSFVATAHAIWWNGLTPVFVDVDPLTGNLDPAKIESAITPRTSAIMPVHVYGQPCDTERIQAIADKYNLKVIYDAAHAFGVQAPQPPKGGEGSNVQKLEGSNVCAEQVSILNAGDISTLSFHATKAYNTVEGGALICHTAAMKDKIDQLKNFGFTGETSVVAPGINSKMDEIRAAYGLVNLRHVDAAIAHRKEVARQYVKALQHVAGLTILPLIQESIECEADFSTRLNYSYFPVFIDERLFGMSRDALYEKLKRYNILGRRYFYPLITDFSPYKSYPSATQENLPVANRLAQQVICLPIHDALTMEDVNRIIDIIKN